MKNHPLINISPLKNYGKSVDNPQRQMIKSSNRHRHRKSQYTKLGKFCTLNIDKKQDVAIFQVNGLAFETKTYKKNKQYNNDSEQNGLKNHNFSEQQPKKKYTYFIRKLGTRKDDYKFYRQNLLQPCKISPILMSERLSTPRRKLTLQRRWPQNQRINTTKRGRKFHRIEKNQRNTCTQQKIEPWAQSFGIQDSNF